MTTKANKPGRSLPIRGVAALAVSLLLAGCASAKAHEAPLQQACRTSETVISSIEQVDDSGIYQVDDLAAAPSVYQTTWRLLGAHEIGMSLIEGNARNSVRHNLINVALGPESYLGDPGLEGLELHTTAAIGLAALRASPQQRQRIAEVIDGYRVGGEYRATKSEEPSAYATYVAVQALAALDAPVPDEVERSLARSVVKLPEPTYQSLDDIIVPRVGAFALAGGKLPSKTVNRSVLRKWKSLIAQSSEDGLAVSLASNITTIGKTMGIEVDYDGSAFYALRSGGGWAPQRGAAADAKTTYFAAHLGLRQLGLKRYLRSLQAKAGWLPEPGAPTVQGTYLAVRAAAKCAKHADLNPQRVASALQMDPEAETSLLDLARLCYIEGQLNIDIVPHEDLTAPLKALAKNARTFDESVELRLASKLCKTPIDAPLHLKPAVERSRYHYAGAEFVAKSPGWGGVTVPPRTKPIKLSKGYKLLLDSVLQGNESEIPSMFRCGTFYCPIAKNGRGDSSSASPTLASMVTAIEGLSGNDRGYAILAGY